MAISALLRGYRIFREPYAKRIATDADDLDARVARIARTWLEALRVRFAEDAVAAEQR